MYISFSCKQLTEITFGYLEQEVARGLLKGVLTVCPLYAHISEDQNSVFKP